MKKVYLQYWEESEKGWGIRPDGCSLHIDVEEHKKYINSIYENRKINEVPNEYDRIIGEPIICFVKDDLLESLKKKGTIRLLECETNNLLKLEEITIII
jgi:hypothetical protein